METFTPAIRFALLGLLLFAESLLASLSPGTGTFTFTHPENGDRVVVFYALADSYDPATPPVLVLHGMNRNPWDYRDAWIDLAAQYNFLVVVPYFREKEFPGTVGYNLGNVFASEKDLTRTDPSVWSYRIPEIVYEELRSMGMTTAPGYLAFGHSAGSQFLHRKIGFAPDSRLLLAVSANAGWYTLPDLEETWPYGYGGTGLTNEDLPPYLASNLVILLGDQDTDPHDDSLRRAPEAMRQGKHRLERGGYFFKAGEERARELGVPFNWRIQEVPGVGHDNAGMAPAAAEIMARTIRNRRDSAERN
jgi:hypothetical protein